jgi:hypothetical protein
MVRLYALAVEFTVTGQVVRRIEPGDSLAIKPVPIRNVCKGVIERAYVELCQDFACEAT